MYASCKTLVLPKTSLIGPSSNGPGMYARTKMDSNMAVWKPWGTSSSAEICSRAGAIIDEATGVMKVNIATVIVASHFLLDDQFLGFSGSFGPSQPVLVRAGIDGVESIFVLLTLASSSLTRVFSVWERSKWCCDSSSICDTDT